jgi:hypothetical protein
MSKPFGIVALDVIHSSLRIYKAYKVFGGDK